MADQNEKLFDRRVVERNIDKGKITSDDYEAFVEALDDVEDNAETIESEFEAGIFEDDDEDGEEAEGDGEEAEDEDE